MEDTFLNLSTETTSSKGNAKNAVNRQSSLLDGQEMPEQIIKLDDTITKDSTHNGTYDVVKQAHDDGTAGNPSFTVSAIYLIT